MRQSVVAVFLMFLISACSQNQKTNAPALADDQLLDTVQYQTFQYFWDGAEPNSGLACERIHTDNIYPQNDKHIVTTVNSGFG